MHAVGVAGEAQPEIGGEKRLESRRDETMLGDEMGAALAPLEKNLQRDMRAGLQ